MTAWQAEVMETAVSVAVKQWCLVDINKAARLTGIKVPCLDTPLDIRHQLMLDTGAGMLKRFIIAV